MKLKLICAGLYLLLCYIGLFCILLGDKHLEEIVKSLIIILGTIVSATVLTDYLLREKI